MRLHLSRPEDLMRCLNPRSTVFVLMPDPPAEDTVVECVLVHPTKGDELMLFARVARRGTTLAGPGVELRFDPLDGSGREALLAFMRRTGRSSDGPGV
ncbi:MAG: PilZ domain-containing protein [Myxococcales bacterium]|nr:PilZ domain-containing protein [Myxococcales bacterium]